MKFLTTKQVAARYGNRTERTIYNWVKEGKFPRPVYRNGFKFWEEGLLDEHDRQRPQETPRQCPPSPVTGRLKTARQMIDGEQGEAA